MKAIVTRHHQTEISPASILEGLHSSIKLSEGCIGKRHALDLLNQENVAVIDVRAADCEKQFSSLPNTYRIAFHEENIIERFQKNDFGIQGFDNITSFIFVCAYGLRSQNVVSRLKQAGMENVHHLCGGLEALEAESPDYAALKQVA